MLSFSHSFSAMVLSYCARSSSLEAHTSSESLMLSFYIWKRRPEKKWCDALKFPLLKSLRSLLLLLRRDIHTCICNFLCLFYLYYCSFCRKCSLSTLSSENKQWSQLIRYLLLSWQTFARSVEDGRSSHTNLQTGANRRLYSPCSNARQDIRCTETAVCRYVV